MKNYLDPDFIKNFTTAYNNLYNLHPQINNDEFRFKYLRVDWFFPNHINNVLIQIKKIGESHYKNEIDFQVCLYAALFHDAGLIYKRDTPDPTGHENRSVEYAKIELKNFGYDDNFINEVSECIKSTELDHNPTSKEAQLLRNADAYAHIISMHFFGKANFTKEIDEFIDWFEDKVESTFYKINLTELSDEVEPLIEKYREMIINYKENKLESDFLATLFAEYE